MQETIDTDREGNPLTYMDIIAEEDTIADDLDVRIQCDKVRRLVAEILDKREREIITMRYGLGGTAPMAQRQCAEKLGISTHQLSYVTQAPPGEGLLFFGNVIIPFVDHFPKDTNLYRIMTTKPDEMIQEHE